MLTLEVAFKLGDACEHGGHHTSMGTVAFKRHSVHGDDRDIPASQLVLRVEQVLGESAPLAEFSHQHRVNFF